MYKQRNIICKKSYKTMVSILIGIFLLLLTSIPAISFDFHIATPNQSCMEIIEIPQQYDYKTEIYLATDEGIYKSGNGGKSWSILSNLSTRIHDIYLGTELGFASNVILAGTDFGLWFYSIDGWTCIGLENKSVQTLDGIPGTHQMLAGTITEEEYGIFHTSDLVNWTRSLIFPSQNSSFDHIRLTYVYQIKISDNTPNIVYAIARGIGFIGINGYNRVFLLRSTDGGYSFRECLSLPENISLHKCLAVDPFDSNIIAFGGWNGLAISTDGGITFDLYNQYYVSDCEFLNLIIWSPLYFGSIDNDIGLWYSFAPIAPFKPAWTNDSVYEIAKHPKFGHVYVISSSHLLCFEVPNLLLSSYEIPNVPIRDIAIDYVNINQVPQ